MTLAVNNLNSTQTSIPSMLNLSEDMGKSQERLNMSLSSRRKANIVEKLRQEDDTPHIITSGIMNHASLRDEPVANIKDGEASVGVEECCELLRETFSLLGILSSTPVAGYNVL